MTKQEFDDKIKEIERKMKLEKRELYNEYALSNNPHKVGDIVSDHKGTIKIEKIKIVLGFRKEYPECVYIGSRLRKDLKPFKSGEHDFVYQSNMEVVS
jgi:hypothetical protein